MHAALNIAMHAMTCTLWGSARAGYRFRMWMRTMSLPRWQHALPQRASTWTLCRRTRCLSPAARVHAGW